MPQLSSFSKIKNFPVLYHSWTVGRSSGSSQVLVPACLRTKLTHSELPPGNTADHWHRSQNHHKTQGNGLSVLALSNTICSQRKSLSIKIQSKLKLQFTYSIDGKQYVVMVHCLQETSNCSCFLFSKITSFTYGETNI